MSQNNQYNTIEEALRDLREGKVILVTDDPDRENEGDLVCASRVCNTGEYQFYGDLCERAYLYTDECGNCSKA